MIDIILGEQEHCFKHHKFILLRHSDFFRRCLQAQTIEGMDAVVKLDRFEPVFFSFGLELRYTKAIGDHKRRSLFTCSSCGNGNIEKVVKDEALPTMIGCEHTFCHPWWTSATLPHLFEDALLVDQIWCAVPPKYPVCSLQVCQRCCLSQGRNNTGIDPIKRQTRRRQVATLLPPRDIPSGLPDCRRPYNPATLESCNGRLVLRQPGSRPVGHPFGTAENHWFSIMPQDSAICKWTIEALACNAEIKKRT